MCKQCHEERDDDYKGDSIQEKRVKSIRSVLERHPELGLDHREVTLHYTPKAEKHCVRVNNDGRSPKYDIHVPTRTAVFMRDGVPLRGLAYASFIETDLDFEEICEILEVDPPTPHGAYFFSEEPPLNYPGDERVMLDYENGIQENRKE